jgi:hypothetical protein
MDNRALLAKLSIGEFAGLPLASVEEGEFMHVRVFVETQSPNFRAAEKAAAIANHYQSKFFVTVHEDDLAFLPMRGEFIDYKSVPISLRSAFIDSPTLVLTERRFDNNWFGFTGPRQALVSLADWSSYFAPPSSMSFILHRIARSALCFSTDATLNDIENIFREDTVGCAFDFCRLKTDVKFGLYTGHLSSQSRGRLMQFGAREDFLAAAQSVFDVVRLEATGRGGAYAFDEAFVVMKYSEGDDNDNAYRHGIRLALEGFGLKPIRADENPQTRSLSAKVVQHIEKSRLIVVKLDNPNPNVFFELGYALAAKKDLLTIIPVDQLDAVPSDIRGWELVTYSPGRYEDLASKVRTYLGNILPHRT